MDRLDELEKLEDFRLSELLHELNHGDALRTYPELGEAYAKYMAAVADTQRYCFSQVAAMNRARNAENRD